MEKEHINHEHSLSHNEEGQRERLILLITGILLFTAGMIAERTHDGNAFIFCIIYLAGYIVLGKDVIIRALKNILRGQIFDENLLMSAATLGAFAIGKFSEAVAVMLLYQIGELIQDSAVRKSRKSISALMDIRPDYANVKINGEMSIVAPDQVKIGEHIFVKPGEKIPLDGIIIGGEGLLDTRSITGESLPRYVSNGDTALSGCVNQTGLLTIEVAKPFEESTVAKIIDLVENAGSRKAPTENFITTFSRYYTPVVVFLAFMISVIPPLFLMESWTEWIHRGLIFLVISCPCALVISIPLGFYGGIGSASRKGILVKGGNYLEALNNLDIIVFDKTGTLTKGDFKVAGIQASDGYTEEQVLEIAAYAESCSNHPIALSIGKAYTETVNRERLNNYTEIAGRGISVILDGKRVLAGSEKLMRGEGVSIPGSAGVGTKVHIAFEARYMGCVMITDEIKPDSRNAILDLKENGVRKAIMLTGDSASIAENITRDISLDEVYAELLPHEKVDILEKLEADKRPGGKLAFVGDGINDAPVLARADIGIAMGGLGSDAAIEAADVVLMTDEPSKLVTVLEIAKATHRIVWQNIIFALGIKCIVLLLGAFGFTSMWEAVFADVGVTLLAILNSMRVLRV